MPRPRKIWRRSGSEYYYTKIDGKQTRLERTASASQRKLEKILRGQGGGPADPGISFARLADLFLDHSEAENEKETFEVHKLFLQSFVDFVGKRRAVGRLCEADLDGWCRAKATWGDNTRVRAKAVVLACLNYGVRKLNLPGHPLRNARPGTCGSRDRYLTPEERKKIREKVRGPFADYVLALERTGARPFSELAKVTAADVDLAAGTATLARWKNSRKQKGKKRVIFLVGPVLDLVRRLVLKHPEGPLFRNQEGRPWTRQALTARFRSLGKRVGIAGLKAYHLRHAYISDALARGVPVAVVAQLCGTSIQTIARHYDKLNQMHDVLREAAERAAGLADVAEGSAVGG
jgi:integrase